MNETRYPRPPLSVTIIGWALIVLTTIGLLVQAFMLTPEVLDLAERISGLSNPSLAYLSILSGVVNLACGVGLLLRNNFARLLYLTFAPLYSLAVFLLSDFSPMVFGGLPLYFVIFYFLTRPAVRAYFTLPAAEVIALQAARATDKPTQPPLSRAQIIRRLVSIPFLFIGQEFVTVYAVAWLAFFSSVATAVLSTILILFLAALGIVPGLLIWGRKDRGFVVAVVLVVIAGQAALLGLSLWVTLLTPGFSEFLGQDADPGTGQRMVRSALISTPLFLTGGLLLLRRAIRARSASQREVATAADRLPIEPAGLASHEPDQR